MNIEKLDLYILIVYAVIILLVGIYAAKGKKGSEKNSEDYFFSW